MRRSASILIVFLMLIPTVALGVTRSVGQTIVYDFDEVTHSTPVIPPGMSAENQAKMKAAQNSPLSFVLTLTLDQVSSDGTAHAKSSLVNKASANLSASLLDPVSDFVATLAPDGEILAQYDPNMQPKTGAGGEYTNMKEVSLNSVGGQVMTHIPYFNTFAKGCATHSHDPAHATWHETMTDSLFGQRSFSFTASDNGPVTMKGNVKNQYISQTITATGKCDSTTGLVVDYHEQIDNTMTSGPPSSITRDLKLRQ